MREIFKKRWFPWVAFSILIVISISSRYFADKRKAKLFLGETKTIKVKLDDAGTAFNNGYTLWFKFKENNKIIEKSWSRGGYTFLEKGDTILIKYSVEDPTVIEVVDPCYMQKHNGKSYCH